MIQKNSFAGLLLCIALFFGFSSFAQVNVYDGRDTFPKPPLTKNTLFYLQRTPNANTILYDLNVNNKGELDKENPIHVYWIRYTEPGHPKKDLNYIQRKFAYGVKVKKLSGDEWDIRLVAYDKVKLTLKKDQNGQYKVFTNINKKEAVFDKSYIRIDEGGSFWKPNVKYIEIFGHDSQTKVKDSYRILL